MTLFPRFEVNVWVLMIFFLFWRSTSGRRKNLTSKEKKIIMRRQNNSEYCGLRLRKCNAHLRLRNTSCSFGEFAVAELGVNLRCPVLVYCVCSMRAILIVCNTLVMPAACFYAMTIMPSLWFLDTVCLYYAYCA